MRLFTAIVPPHDVLVEVREVVRSAHDVPAVVRDEPGRRGLRRRLRGSDRAEPVATAPSTTHELDAHEMPDLYLPLAGFGNVTLADSIRLADDLRAAVRQWPRPRLRLEGGTALEFPGDRSVWAKLSGDLDALGVVARGVPATVQRLGFFVDRRKFRPWLAVGTITDTTTAPYLERLVGLLEDFEGSEWAAEAVSLMKWVPEAEGGVPYEVVERLPLA